jgi:hypothetical protein
MTWLLPWNWRTPTYETELYEVDVENKAIEEECDMTITICLQAQIEDGKRLGFRVSPKPVTAGGRTGHNPLARIRDSLTDSDQRVVIRSVTRVHAHSDLNVDVSFELSHPFEFDAATDIIQKEVAAAKAVDAAGAVTVMAKTPHGKGSIVNNNNNSVVTNAVRLAQPTDSEDYSGLLSEADDSLGAGARPGNPFPNMTARQQLDKMHRITLRGGQPRPNEAERDNIINLGVVPAMSTTTKAVEVYRASLSDNTIKWFAGQDAVVADKSGRYYVAPKVPPPPAKVVTEGSPAARAATPLNPYVFLDCKDALVIYMKLFCGDMPNIHERMEPMQTDRSDKAIRYYKVDTSLVEDAKKKILYTVFSQMFYTRLKDCIIARRVETNDLVEESIALKLAGDWNLPVDPKTRRISDWSADAYRPVVIITLRLQYTVVNGVSATAASLFKTKTRLVPAK